MRRCVSSATFAKLYLVELAALAAIKDVDAEADGEPNEETYPRARGQSGHQQNAEEHAEDGNDRSEGDAKSAVAVWIFVAQDDDSA